MPGDLSPLDPADYPSILDEPFSEPAVLVAANIDVEAEAQEFSDQSVVIVAGSGDRRSLNLGDLGLMEDDFLSADGSGLGALSPDGGTLAMTTRSRVILLTLATGRLSSFELPDGSGPTAAGWSDNDLLVVGSREDPRRSYLLETGSPDGEFEVLDIPRFQTLVLDDGTVLRFGGGGDGGATVERRSTDGSVSNFTVPFEWQSPLPGVAIGDKVAVFVDSLIETGEEAGSRVEALSLDGDVTRVATLSWPDRKDSDQIIGWLDAQHLLVRQSEEVCVWQPGSARLSCVGGYSPEIAISVAEEVVSLD